MVTLRHSFNLLLLFLHHWYLCHDWLLPLFSVGYGPELQIFSPTQPGEISMDPVDDGDEACQSPGPLPLGPSTYGWCSPGHQLNQLVDQWTLSAAGPVIFFYCTLGWWVVMEVEVCSSQISLFWEASYWSLLDLRVFTFFIPQLAFVAGILYIFSSHMIRWWSVYWTFHTLYFPTW